MTDTEGRLTCDRGCVIRRRHAASCGDRDCLGCLPRLAIYGRLCEPCHRRLTQMLHDWPAIDAWLATHIPRGTRQAPSQDRITGSRDLPTPLDLDVVDLLATMRAAVYGWAEVLREHVGLTIVAHTPDEAARQLARHQARVEAAPWGVDCWAELADLSSQAHALAPWRAEMRRCPGIPCPRCTAPSLVIFGGDEDVTCLECREAIPPERYEIWTRMLLDEAG